MSRTYKYPRTSLEDKITRKESEAELRIRKKIERQKQQKRQKTKTARLSKKTARFWDKQKSR